jgi:hypothetical protein
MRLRKETERKRRADDAQEAMVGAERERKEEQLRNQEQEATVISEKEEDLRKKEEAGNKRDTETRLGFLEEDGGMYIIS